MTNFLKKIFSSHKGNAVESESICPYCKNTLEKKPTRKKKCSNCNNFIFVRTLPSTRQKVLVTENEAKKIDLEWDKVNYRKNAINQLSSYGINEKNYDNRKKELSKKLNSEANDGDVVWSLLNEQLNKKMKDNDFGFLSMIYADMALILYKEGKDCFTYQQQATKMVLLSHKQSSFNNVKILTCGINSCEACQKLDGKVFTIEEALEKMPIPVKECSTKMYDKNRGFCRCCYNIVTT